MYLHYINLHKYIYNYKPEEFVLLKQELLVPIEKFYVARSIYTGVITLRQVHRFDVLTVLMVRVTSGLNYVSYTALTYFYLTMGAKS